MTTENIQISKNAFNVMRVTIGVLLVALLWILYTLPNDKQPEHPILPVDEHIIPDSYDIEIPPTLIDFFKQKNIVTLTLTDKAGRVKPFTPSGSQLEPCGEEIDGKITGDCNLENIKLTRVNQLLIVLASSNPNCMYKKYGNKWYEVHDGTQAKWPAGAYPCDNDPLNEHVLKG